MLRWAHSGTRSGSTRLAAAWVALLLLACGSGGGNGATAGDAGGGNDSGGDASPTPKCTRPGDMPLVWGRRIASGAQVTAMALAPDGSMRLTGSFGYVGAVTFGPGEPGQTQLPPISQQPADTTVWVARLAPDGTLAWAKSAGSTLTAKPFQLAVAGDGSTRVVGSFAGQAIFGKGEPHETTLTATAKSDLFVASYAADGTLAWAKRAGGTGMDSFLTGSAVVGPDGSTAVTGRFLGSATFGPGESKQTMLAATNSGPEDQYGNGYLAKLDATGALVWASLIKDTPYVPNLGLASDGSLLLVGIGGPVTFAPASASPVTVTGPLFFARYDASGNLVSAVSPGAASQPYAPTLVRTDWTSDGSALVLATFQGSVTLGKGEPAETTLTVTGAQGQEDAFVARFGPDAKLAWARQISGVQGRSLGLAGDSSLRLAAQYSGAPLFDVGRLDATKLSGAGGSALANYGTDGGLVTAEQAADQGSIGAMAVSAADGSLRTAGEFAKSVTLGPGQPTATTLAAASIFDLYVARYDVCP